ncbi:hypothetical protein FB451DRAFT_1267971 [Mycena latifolia]|nr:hypothetical protein FB451DRAFT_1267971 [Mycena latifolia]
MPIGPNRSLKHENPGFCDTRPSIKQVADYLVWPGRQSQIIYDFGSTNPFAAPSFQASGIEYELARWPPAQAPAPSPQVDGLRRPVAAPAGWHASTSQLRLPSVPPSPSLISLLEWPHVAVAAGTAPETFAGHRVAFSPEAAGYVGAGIGGSLLPAPEIYLPAGAGAGVMADGGNVAPYELHSTPGGSRSYLSTGAGTIRDGNGVESSPGHSWLASSGLRAPLTPRNVGGRLTGNSSPKTPTPAAR